MLLGKFYQNFMKYKRIFCFGCSFTEYQWPTWANIIQKDLDIPVYNWGLCGIGNRGILSKMIQCDIKYSFNKDDLIIVVWSSWTREDRYIDGHWRNHGNLLNQDFYDKNFIKKYWDWENDIINNATCIIAANKMYSDVLNASIVPLKNPQDIYISDKTQLETIQQKNQKQMINFYIDKLPSMEYFDMSKNSYFDKTTTDGHPDIRLHQLFVEQTIYGKLRLQLKESTIHDISSFFNKTVESFSHINKDGYDWHKLVDACKTLWHNGNWQRTRIYDWNSDV